jgi:hypothetical protein
MEAVQLLAVCLARHAPPSKVSLQQLTPACDGTRVVNHEAGLDECPLPPGSQLGIECPLPNDFLLGNGEIFRYGVNDLGDLADILNFMRQIDCGSMFWVSGVMLHGKWQAEIRQPKAEPDIVIEIIVVLDDFGIESISNCGDVYSKYSLWDQVSLVPHFVKISCFDHDVSRLIGKADSWLKIDDDCRNGREILAGSIFP